MKIHSFVLAVGLLLSGYASAQNYPSLRLHASSGEIWSLRTGDSIPKSFPANSGFSRAIQYYQSALYRDGFQNALCRSYDGRGTHFGIECSAIKKAKPNKATASAQQPRVSSQREVYKINTYTMNEDGVFEPNQLPGSSMNYDEATSVVSSSVEAIFRQSVQASADGQCDVSMIPYAEMSNLEPGSARPRVSDFFLSIYKSSESEASFSQHVVGGYTFIDDQGREIERTLSGLVDCKHYQDSPAVSATGGVIRVQLKSSSFLKQDSMGVYFMVDPKTPQKKVGFSAG